MSLSGIEEAFNDFDHSFSKHNLGVLGSPIGQLDLHAAQEASDHNNVLRLTSRVQGRRRPCLPSTFGECPGDELRILIPIDHGPCFDVLGIDPHGRCVGSQVWFYSGINWSVEYPTRARVQDGKTERSPSSRLKFGHTGHPGLICVGASGVPLDQISDGGPGCTPVVVAVMDPQDSQTGATHQ